MEDTLLRLWLACGVWALFVSLPLIARLWDKYTYWVMKNFGNKE
jgi:hypothetical protein